MSNINMSSISMVESKLPPGFRFHPRDEELVCDYLFNKLRLQLQIQQNNNHDNSHSSSPHDRNSHYNYFIEVDLNKSEPWEIPESACVGGKEWYFYSQRDRKYATGLRTNRATASGYWKATGKDKAVLRKGGGGALVGMRKTLVFYQGRAPKGRKSDWVMHEFRLEGSLAPKLSSLKEDWVLCRVFYKSREAKLPNNETNFMGGISRASNSLPALMDAYIRFDQPKPPPHISSHHDHHHHDHHHHDYHQQVSCFSNSNINNYPISSHGLISPNLQTSTSTTTSTSAEAKLGGGVESAVLDPFCGDNENEVLKTLLNQLTNMESNPHLNQFCL